MHRICNSSFAVSLAQHCMHCLRPRSLAVVFTVTMAMQSHANEEICQRAVKILETYFVEEDDGEIDGIEGPIV